MRIELDVADVFLLLCIDDAECAAAVSNIKALGWGVVAHIVGVIEAAYLSRWLERCRIVKPERPIIAVGHDHPARIWHKCDASWLAESLHALNALSLRHVDDFERVVPQRRQIKPVSLNVGREVIEAAFDSGQFNDLNLSQPLGVLCRWLYFRCRRSVSAASGSKEKCGHIK